jgi:hypothetical protein
VSKQTHAAFHARPEWLWGVYRRLRDGTFNLWPQTVRATRADAIKAYVELLTLSWTRDEYERDRRRGDVVTLRVFAQADIPASTTDRG